MVGSLRLCLVTLSLGLGAIATPAAANTITYDWFGIVDQIDPFAHPGVTIGEKIKISLTLDGAVPDIDPSSEIGQYSGTSFPPPQPAPLVLAVDIGGFTSLGSFQEATVLNDHNGTDAFSVSTGDFHIGTEFSFDFSTSNLGVLTSDALPLSINPGDFDAARFQVQGDFVPGYSGRIVSLGPGTVPLPGSVGMLCSALSALVGAGWWKLRRFGATAH